MKAHTSITVVMIFLFLLLGAPVSEASSYDVMHEYSITPDFQLVSNPVVTYGLHAAAYVWNDVSDSDSDEDSGVITTPTVITIDALAATGLGQADGYARVAVDTLDLSSVSGSIRTWGSASVSGAPSAARANSSACYMIYGPYLLMHGEILWRPIMGGSVSGGAREILSQRMLDPLAFEVVDSNNGSSTSGTLFSLSCEYNGDASWGNNDIFSIGSSDANLVIDMSSSYLSNPGTLYIEIDKVENEVGVGEVTIAQATGFFSSVGLPALGTRVSSLDPLELSIDNDLLLDYDLTNAIPGANPDDLNVTFESCNGATATAVPEPATMTLLGLGALALLRRRRT